MANKALNAALLARLEYLRGIGFEELHGVDLAESSTGAEHGVDRLVATDRAVQLDKLATAASTCTACKLSATRNRVVFGSGASNADLMFVGEGPGAEEDRRGLPFVGPAGDLLTRIIEAIGLEREQVYIANVVKCRPPGNRDPEPEEVRACWRFLERQIEFVSPRIVVALGRVAAQNILDTDESLGRLRGRWHDLGGVPVRVTYHPAALLRNTSWKRPTWEDMQIVRDRLQGSDSR